MYRLSLRCQSSKSTEFTLNWHGFHFFPFLALKIWALVVLKFFDVVLKFELPNARVLNFPKISASSLILAVLINGDCVYVFVKTMRKIFFQILCVSQKSPIFMQSNVFHLGWVPKPKSLQTCNCYWYSKIVIISANLVNASKVGAWSTSTAFPVISTF